MFLFDNIFLSLKTQGLLSVSLLSHLMPSTKFHGTPASKDNKASNHVNGGWIKRTVEDQMFIVDLTGALSLEGVPVASGFVHLGFRGSRKAASGHSRDGTRSSGSEHDVGLL
uniref:Uncharacterized protein n=1 Tax=Entomoneis paludosa TaxID=265537 RepID=A0A7S2YH36_9STRA